MRDQAARQERVADRHQIEVPGGDLLEGQDLHGAEDDPEKPEQGGRGAPTENQQTRRSRREQGEARDAEIVPVAETDWTQDDERKLEKNRARPLPRGVEPWLAGHVEDNEGD